MVRGPSSRVSSMKTTVHQRDAHFRRSRAFLEAPSLRSGEYLPRPAPMLESVRRRAAHEDAEGMSGDVGVHTQRLLGIFKAVQEQPGPERQGPLVLSLEILCRGHHQI